MATEDPATSSAPTPEQRDLAALLREVIGHVFADRFLDFCRLSNSAGKTDLALRATLPLAAHAMRELESILRQYLRTPFGASAEPDKEALAKRQQTEAALLLLAFDSNKIRNALRELEVPKHADEIKGVCGKLGIAQDGEVAKAWLNLVSTQAELTHRRSAHELPVVGEAFRRDFARPFQMLVGEVALALQRHYSAYIREVDKLVIATDHVKAVNDFRKNIPGTPPLQKRFYEKIAGAGWLAPLRAKGLLRAPVPNLDDKEAGVIRWIEWPPALYLARMARSDDAAARAQVTVVLRELQDAEEFGLRDKCFEVATALPAAEAAGLTDVAVEWLKPRWYWTLKAPEEYLKHLIKGEERAAVLRVAHALFGISRNEAGVVSRYDRFDYEHSTPPFVEPITALCGLDALDLYCDLLMQAALAKELIHDDPPRDFSSSSDAFAHESKAQHDIFASVAWATRRCAEQLLKKDPANIGPIVDVLVAQKYRIFLQLALKLAATAPEQAGDRARQLLMRPDLLGQSWCAKDYGDLARVSFGGLDQQDQRAILREIDVMPDRDGPIWARNFEAMRGHPATEEEMARIKLLFRRDIFWHWRDVLPTDRRTDIDRIVAEYGKPYGEDDPRFSWEGQRDESPVSAADIVAKPIAELVAFLKDWKPGEGEEQLTASALGMELRNAVEFEPQRFAASAGAFEDVGSYYLLRILEGLDSQAKNHKPFDWAPVLVLLAKVIARAKAASPAITAGSRDEPSWSWVLLTATSLIRDGFIEGNGKIPLSHADEVWNLIEALWSAPPIVPDDFASRLEQDAFFAAQATLRGSVLEAAIWFGNWSDPRKGEVQPAQLRVLSARVRAILDQTLALQDGSDSGTPAILGRYFDWLLILDRAWVDANKDAMLGATASVQRKELIWEGHLLHGRSTLLTWDFFQSFANEEIERIDQPGYNNDWRGKQLTQFLLYFYYWGMIGLEPGGPLMRFLSRADASLREHGVWSMMHDLNRADLPQDKRDRLHAYYDARITAAAASGNREGYRRELGMLGIWFGKNKAENGWMLQQLHKLAALKLTPPHPADFFTWLDSLMPEQTEEVIASLAYVVEDDGFERWMFAASNQLVRKILTTGMASPDPETVKRAKQIANVLVAKGQSDLFDLAQ